MNKKSYPIVALSLLLTISTAILLSVFTPSCTKLDVNEHRSWRDRKEFFDLPVNADPALKKVAAEFERQNKLTGFVNGMVAREGMPVWEKSRVTRYSNRKNTLSRDGDENETNDIIEVFIPIVLNNADVVNGFFFSKIVGDSVALHLYRAIDFDKYPYGKTDSSIVTAELITVKLLGLNEDVFGHRKFQLTDSNLFSVPNHRSGIRTIEIDTSVQGRAMVECGFVCYYNFTPECISPTNLCTFCELVGCATEYCPTMPPYSNPYTWPPEPPVYTSSGGSGGSPSNTPGGGNCTGDNDCGTRGSEIIEGRIPCGGCGDPPIVVIPIDDPPVIPPTDTCADALNLAKKMDTLYMKLKIDSMLNTMTNWQTDTFERGFPGYKTFTQNSTTGAVSITSYYPGTVQGSAANYNVDITFTVPSGTRAAAKLHNHTSTGLAAPSAGDIYALIDDYFFNFPHPNSLLKYEGSFIAAYNNSKYALAISNPGEALIFSQTRFGNLNPFNGDWRTGYTFWTAARYAFRIFHTADSTTAEPLRTEKAFELSQASILSYYHSGINLFKQDNNGKFKPIIVDGFPDPANPLGRLYIQKCL